MCIFLQDDNLKLQKNSICINVTGMLISANSTSGAIAQQRGRTSSREQQHLKFLQLSLQEACVLEP